MSKNHLLVGGAVALLCAGILVLFTDVEVKMVRWASCGPLSNLREQDSRLCR